MKSIKFIEDALQNIDLEVKQLFSDYDIPMKKKDSLMLSLVQQKSTLEQTLKDLTYLKENPPSSQGCKMQTLRKDN
ncbi:MAG: hypothetical protein GQ570_04275 [Helicobacteraceae bacterium]|nr:hypothetical protein [Helicobacteraceae bacterium]